MPPSSCSFGFWNINLLEFFHRNFNAARLFSDFLDDVSFIILISGAPMLFDFVNSWAIDSWFEFLDFIRFLFDCF